MYLQLRGLCPVSNIDQFYVPRYNVTLDVYCVDIVHTLTRNKKRSGAVELLGLMTSTIGYDTAKVSWTLTEHSKVQKMHKYQVGASSHCNK